MSLILNRLIGFGAKRAAAAGGATGVQEKASETSSGTIDFGTGFHTFANKAFTIDNGATVYRMGAYLTSAKTLRFKIAQLNSGANYTIVRNEGSTVSHTGSGWEWFTLSTPYSVPASGTFYAACYNATGGNTNYQASGGGDANVSSDTTGTATFSNAGYAYIMILGVEY